MYWCVWVYIHKFIHMCVCINVFCDCIFLRLIHFFKNFLNKIALSFLNRFTPGIKLQGHKWIRVANILKFPDFQVPAQFANTSNWQQLTFSLPDAIQYQLILSYEHQWDTKIYSVKVKLKLWWKNNIHSTWSKFSDFYHFC